MDQDWEPTVIRKHRTAGQLRSNAAVNSARRTGGEVETEKKYGGGANKSTGTGLDSAKLDRETEELSHKTLDHNVAKLISKGRTAKGLTQKELATRINEKPQTINDYESGKAIPNPQLLGKIERIIGIKLRGKNIGEPLSSGPKKK